MLPRVRCVSQGTELIPPTNYLVGTAVLIENFRFLHLRKQPPDWWGLSDGMNGWMTLDQFERADRRPYPCSVPWSKNIFVEALAKVMFNLEVNWLMQARSFITKLFISSLFPFVTDWSEFKLTIKSLGEVSKSLDLVSFYIDQPSL